MIGDVIPTLKCRILSQIKLRDNRIVVAQCVYIFTFRNLNRFQTFNQRRGREHMINLPRIITPVVSVCLDEVGIRYPNAIFSEGKVILGGWLIVDDNPFWECRACGLQFS